MLFVGQVIVERAHSQVLFTAIVDLFIRGARGVDLHVSSATHLESNRSIVYKFCPYRKKLRPYYIRLPISNLVTGMCAEMQSRE